MLKKSRCITQVHSFTQTSHFGARWGPGGGGVTIARDNNSTQKITRVAGWQCLHVRTIAHDKHASIVASPLKG